MVFAAKVSEVPNWGKKIVSVNGTQVLLVQSKGEFYACEPECPHQGAPLSGALLKEAGTITCQRHGYRFDLKTGACAGFPQYTLKVYPVRVEGENIMVDLG
ncbi:Rieske (2Fe-2S) protein [Geobacter sp. DSM 9736]|uniref:Rieske (2Fe-2S) protein n=1 Tax=Geobacter sp. DSM 9736 TaxID=1277350 RepID=UPI000B50C8FC|nr:Rieske (2Fe-2S) protein [Geobacter sp. DSM 9736]SNB47848.1 Ferredoxin subunit of nitrite reductase or a ring-hydroxylating dioxygenase [Geobacter sp. DSM 9736]